MLIDWVDAMLENWGKWCLSEKPPGDIKPPADWTRPPLCFDEDEAQKTEFLLLKLSREEIKVVKLKYICLWMADESRAHVMRCSTKTFRNKVECIHYYIRGKVEDNAA